MAMSARTMFVFAIYLFVLGVGLIAVPNQLLAPFQIPPTQEVWVRVLGMVTLFLGIYYVTAARHNLLPIMEMSVKLRASVPVFLAGFVALGFAPPVLLVFGAVDLAGAIWTFLTLRSELGPPAPRS